MSAALFLASIGVAAPAPPTAEALMYQGRIAEALTAAQEHAQSTPSDIDAQERYIDLLFTVGLAPKATRAYKARAARHPEDPDAHYLVGRASPSAPASTKAYEKALRIDPEHARSHMGMGAIYLATGRAPDAESAYRRALSLDDDLAEAWSGLVQSFVVQGAQEPALEVARQAMKTVPAAPESYLVVASLSPDPTEVKVVLEAGIRNAGQDSRLRARYADWQLSHGDPGAALQQANRALAANPSSPGALLTRMFADAITSGTIDQTGYRALLDAQGLEKKDPTAALAAYDELVDSYPACALTWMARSRMYKALKRTDRAIADLREALVRDANNVEAHAALGLLLAGDDATREEARPHLARAVKARPYDAGLTVALGTVSAPSDAVRVLGDGWKRFAYDTDVAIAYSDALARNGDKQGAYRVIKEGAERIGDPRLSVALIVVAKHAGRTSEAANLLEDLGRETGNSELIDAAVRMRADKSDGR